MSEQPFLRSWYTGVGIAAAVVVAVAALLLAIIGTARGILANAGRALEVANQIVTNTRPIWEIERTNAVAVQLRDGAAAIAGHAAEVAEALERPPPVRSATLPGAIGEGE